MGIYVLWYFIQAIDKEIFGNYSALKKRNEKYA